MKIRIYKAIPTYWSYLNSFYKSHLINEPSSFASRLESLKNDCFQWVLSWAKYNNDSGIELFETIPNDFYLQNAWSTGRYNITDNWEKDIVFEQIKEFKPHICILYSPEIYDTAFINRIKELDHNIIVGGYDGMDRQNIRLYEGYDFVITCSEFISQYYLKHGMPAYSMRFGFDPSILTKTIKRSIRYPVSFSGSIFPGIHNNRFELVTYLQKHTKIVLSSEYGYSPNGSVFSRRIIRQAKALPISRLHDFFLVYHNNVGPKYGIEMFQFLRDSGIVLNMHGDSIRFAANIRLFEATGIGSCLLTDWKENIADLFEPEKEVLTYRSKEEALDKALFCIKRPTFAADIAKRGQFRTLSEYSYERIVPDVILFVKNQFS